MRYVFASLSIFLLFFVISPVFAYNFIDDSGLSETAGPAGYDLDSNENTLEQTLARNITLVLSLVGVIFLIRIIYGGIIWMTAQGNDEKVAKSKKIIINSIIGLIIVVSAYAVSYLILEFILDISWQGSTSEISE